MKGTRGTPIKRSRVGAKEMAHQLTAQAALPGDQSSIPRTTCGLKTACNASFKIFLLLWALHKWCTDIHSGKNTYVHKIKFFKKKKSRVTGRDGSADKRTYLKPNSEALIKGQKQLPQAMLCLYRQTVIQEHTQSHKHTIINKKLLRQK